MKLTLEMNKITRKFNEEFAKAKRKVLIRDRWTCQFNDINNSPHFGALTVDHIQRRSTGGTNAMKNLITVCLSHHDYIEALPQEQKSAILYRLLSEQYGYKYS